MPVRSVRSFVSDPARVAPWFAWPAKRSPAAVNHPRRSLRKDLTLVAGLRIRTRRGRYRVLLRHLRLGRGTRTGPVSRATPSMPCTTP
jgi:hypothetical protein